LRNGGAGRKFSRNHEGLRDMGLLDELEQEAAKLRGNAQPEDDAQATRGQVWREQLQPAAEKLGQYLAQLASRLEAAKRRIRFAYVVPGYGNVVAYAEPPFQCKAVPGAGQLDVEFSMAAQVASAECPIVMAETPGRVSEEVKNANGEVVSGRFQARGKILINLHATASAESGQLKLVFSNVEDFGALTRVFAPDAVNDEFLDSLGRYLLRATPGFGSQGLAAELREKLKQQVQRDQSRREWEARLAEQLREDEAAVIGAMAATASPLALIGRIQRWFGKR
jgi:hypothetical protein